MPEEAASVSARRGSLAAAVREGDALGEAEPCPAASEPTDGHGGGASE
jgi:hypothetical protein